MKRVDLASKTRPSIIDKDGTSTIRMSVRLMGPTNTEKYRNTFMSECKPARHCVSSNEYLYF